MTRKGSMTHDETAEAERPAYITLQAALKLADLVESGGQAKRLIQGGEVMVNGETETRRRRKLYPGDTVTLDESTIEIGAEAD